MSDIRSLLTTAASVGLTEDSPPSSFAETGSVSLRDEEDDISDDADEPAEDGSEGEKLQNGPSQARTNRGPRLPSRSDVLEMPSSRGQKRRGEEMGFYLEKIQKTMEESVKQQDAFRKLLEDRYRTNPVQNSRSDGRIAALEGKVAALERKVSRIAALEREVEKLRSETKALEANVNLLMEERMNGNAMTPFSSNS